MLFLFLNSLEKEFLLEGLVLQNTPSFWVYLCTPLKFSTLVLDSINLLLDFFGDVMNIHDERYNTSI